MTCDRKIGPYDCCSVVQGDCLELMKALPDGCIDAVITSPPYGELREYKGYEFLPVATGDGAHRILVDGGILVWVCGDSVSCGSENLEPFRQAIALRKTGLRLHDTMIYWKDAFPFPDKTRYAQVFEFMFVFSKGAPKTTNIIRVPTEAHNRVKSKSSTYRMKNGATAQMIYEMGKPERNMENVWIYDVGYNKSSGDLIAHEHPAIFPDALALDHVVSWTNPGDAVLDPFLGSGTTAVAAKKLGRHFLGFEISEDYCRIARERIALVENQGVLFQPKAEQLKLGAHDRDNRLPGEAKLSP